MPFDKFKDINFNCIKLGVAWCVEMLTQWLRSIRFGNVTEVFTKAFFQFSLGLTHVEFVAMCASQTVDEIAAVAGEFAAALRGEACIW